MQIIDWSNSTSNDMSSSDRMGPDLRIEADTFIESPGDETYAIGLTGYFQHYNSAYSEQYLYLFVVNLFVAPYFGLG